MLLSERLEWRHSASDPCNIAYLTFEKIKGFFFTFSFPIHRKSLKMNLLQGTANQVAKKNDSVKWIFFFSFPFLTNLQFTTRNKMISVRYMRVEEYL